MTAALGSGAALDTFRRMVRQQGGDPRVVDDPGLLPSAPSVATVRAPRAGTVTAIRAGAIGRASHALGAGRSVVGEAIDHAVGARLLVDRGDAVKAGDELVELHHRDARGSTPRRRSVAPPSSSPTRARRPTTASSGEMTETTRAAPVQAWTRHDAIVLAGLAGVAAVAIVLGTLGATRLQPIGGLALILAIAYCLSSARHAIDYRTVGWGLGLQFLFALVVLKTDAGRAVFQAAGRLITRILDYTYVGSSLVFGPLGNPDVWPRVMTAVLGDEGRQCATIFAFQVLPTIIFIAALFAMLYYFGVMQLVVRVFAVVMRRFMRASGAESMNVAASIFMGQTEAPLTIRPFLPRLTESELMTVMTAGMAHISGGVMAAYILFGVEAQHLLTAVIMTAPGTLMMAKLFVPETGEPETMGVEAAHREDRRQRHRRHRPGYGEGLHLALNVGAMLISFLAIVALLNAALGLAGLSMQQILGWVFAPIAWSLGVPWRDAPTIGNLLGTRMVLNEFVAYSQLGPLKATLDPKSLRSPRSPCAASPISARLASRSAASARWPGAAPRPRPVGTAGDARRHLRQLPHRHHRRHAVMSTPIAPEARKADTVNQPRGGSGTSRLGPLGWCHGHGGRRRDQKPLRGRRAGDRPGLWTRRFRRNAGRAGPHPCWTSRIGRPRRSWATPESSWSAR